MKRQSMLIMNLVFMLAIFGLISSLSPTSVKALNLGNDGALGNEFKDFKVENIAPTEAELSFDTKDPDDVIDSDRLFYTLIESRDDISSLYKSDSNGLETLFDNDAYAISNPELFLNVAGGKIIRRGSEDGLQGGGPKRTISFSGIPENRNYKMHVVAATPQMGTPIVSGEAEPNNVSKASLLEDRYLKVEYTGTVDVGGRVDREFEVSYAHNGSGTDFFETFQEDEDDDLIIEFNQSTNSGSEIEAVTTAGTGEYSYRLRISGQDINIGDSWVFQFDDQGKLKTNEDDIASVPNSEFISESADDPTDNLFKSGDGIVRFSTDPFPSLLPGAGTDGAGFDIDDLPREQSTQYLRGVHANTDGTITLRFDDDIAITAKGEDQIQVLDSEGNDYRDYGASSDGLRRVSSSNSTIEIEYKALKPDEQYYVSVPAGSIALDLGTNGLGQFNIGNEFSEIIFFSEKKPTISSTLFNPGNDTFDHTFSPFSLNPTDEIYRIPSLIGVNKMGVGLNQQLVLKFRSNIVLNGNPISKLNLTASGDGRNLSATAKISETRPNELIVTMNHGDNTKTLLKPDVVYTLNIESGIVRDEFGGSSYSESNSMEIKFKTADGFKNAFLDKSSYELNSGLLQTPSHNIAIDVPKVYIRNVETIHYRQGLAPDAQVAPNLTNVDVEADPDVAYLTVNTNQDERSMLERGANGKFTATFAGLSSNVTQLEITAYDVNENELVTRIFRLQGAPGSEFKNDYVPEITDVFGKRISLYELMQQPDLMRQVLEQIPVSELDRIGVFEPFFAPYNDI